MPEDRRSLAHQASRSCDYPHTLDREEPVLEEENLVPNTGLQAPTALAQELGVADIGDRP